MANQDSLFEDYEENFIELIEGVDLRITKVPQLKQIQKETEIKEVENALYDAENLLDGNTIFHFESFWEGKDAKCSS